MKQLKTITDLQQKRLDYYSSIGDILLSEVNESGYLNIIVKTRSKRAPVKELCFGRRGGLNGELWYDGIDSETNTPIGLIREWSLVQGLIFRRQ